MVDITVIPLVEKGEVVQGNLVASALLTGNQEGPVANMTREPHGAIFAFTRLLPQQILLWQMMTGPKKVGTTHQKVRHILHCHFWKMLGIRS